MKNRFEEKKKKKKKMKYTVEADSVSLGIFILVY